VTAERQYFATPTYWLKEYRLAEEPALWQLFINFLGQHYVSILVMTVDILIRVFDLLWIMGHSIIIIKA
jgi:hypothetical protein